jgi:hypothetical protein
MTELTFLYSWGEEEGEEGKEERNIIPHVLP